MPNQVKNIVAAGNSALSATAISGFSAQGLTATGAAQATALLLSSDVNEVTTTAASTGVMLPLGNSPGDEIIVGNFGASALSVYPSPGESINALAVNTAFSVAANGRAYFVKANPTRWMAILSA